MVDDDEPIEEDSPKTSGNSQLRITPILKQACGNKAPNSVASELVKEMAVYAKAPANPSKLMKVIGRNLVLRTLWPWMKIEIKSRQREFQPIVQAAVLEASIAKVQRRKMLSSQPDIHAMQAHLTNIFQKHMHVRNQVDDQRSGNAQQQIKWTWPDGIADPTNEWKGKHNEVAELQSRVEQQEEIAKDHDQIARIVSMIESSEVAQLEGRKGFVALEVWERLDALIEVSDLTFS